MHQHLSVWNRHRKSAWGSTLMSQNTVHPLVWWQNHPLPRVFIRIWSIKKTWAGMRRHRCIIYKESQKPERTTKRRRSQFAPTPNSHSKTGERQTTSPEERASNWAPSSSSSSRSLGDPWFFGFFFFFKSFCSFNGNWKQKRRILEFISLVCYSEPESKLNSKCAFLTSQILFKLHWF